MTAGEKTEKIRTEVAEEFSGNETATDQLSFIQRYEAAECQLAKRLNDIKGSTHNVLRDRRLGQSFIDILLEPKTESGSVSLQKHYLLDVKVRQRMLSYSDLKSSYLRLQKAVSDYRDSTNVLPNSKLVLVVKEYDEKSERINKLLTNFEMEFKTSAKHSITFISEADLEKFNDADFSRSMGL